MAKLLRFDGRVALVTGAGGGLGKEYALLLASRGAKVVVNDLGGGMHGDSKASSRPADTVVSLIKSRGGTAVPNYDSVEEGEKIVKTAIDNFGRLDILINNAGILRDRTLMRMSDQDWDLVYNVHLKGTFKVTRAAFPYMRKQKYGRIIMTTSPSGLYGNFGQSNYSAAKMGIVGFGNTVAKEGAKYNILCNTIAPQAWSRMTKDLMPPAMEEYLKTEDVAPLVGFLSHEECPENGCIFESAGGWVSKVMLQGSKGEVLSKPFTIEDVQKAWPKICDMSSSYYSTGASESLISVLPRFQEAAGPSDSKPSTGDSFVSSKKSMKFEYTQRDVILYALGIGCTLSQEDTLDLKYLYEGHEKFSVIPSFAVIAAQSLVMNGSMFSEGIPGVTNVNLAQALHGEQYVELLKPLPPSGTLITEGRVVDVVDKKSGAVIVVETQTKTKTGELVAINQFVTFMIGAGGFGGKRSSKYLKPVVPTPQRPPDASRQCKTLTSQAALYRLNGDYNPLHVDADFAKLGGFQTPILHGLCSYGIATRHVLREYCGDDVSNVKAIKARFSKPVIPGNTIQTDMWREENRIHFICKVVETGDVCLSGGYVDLKAVSASTLQNPNSPGNQLPSSSLQSTAIFQQLKEHLSSVPDVVKKVQAVFQWNITKDGKTVAKWTADLKEGSGSIYPGEPKGKKAGCTITISDSDLVDMVMGKLDPQQAFFKGQMKIAGNIMLSQKLQALFPSNQAKL